MSVYLNSLIAPLLVVVVGWLLKDVLLGLYQARQSAIREEWLFRLREVYSPLLLWSGLVMTEGPPSSEKFGVKELAGCLQRAGNLLSPRDYYVFIRTLEYALGQKVTLPDLKERQRARRAVYAKIERLNFVLFKLSPEFDPERYVDDLSSLKLAARSLFTFAIQVVLWASVSLVIGSVFYLGTVNAVVAALLVAIGLLVLFEEFRRRRLLIRKMRQ
jgi:hypothetical protein